MASKQMKQAIEELQQLPGPLVCVVYDTLTGAQGGPRSRVMSPEIKLVSREDCRVIGTAFTVRTTSISMNILEQVGKGDVLVIDASQIPGISVWGQVTSFNCRAKGVNGVVIDGGVRDVLEIRQQGYPVFARYVTAAVAPVSITSGAEIGVPISCGGVTVRPGDLVVGDLDGVIVVSAEMVPDVLEGAKYVAEIERVIAQRVLAGALYYDLPDIRDMWKEKEHLTEPEWKLYKRWLEKYS